MMVCYNPRSKGFAYSKTGAGDDGHKSWLLWRAFASKASKRKYISSI
jgi:hypothetical protein